MTLGAVPLRGWSCSSTTVISASWTWTPRRIMGGRETAVSQARPPQPKRSVAGTRQFCPARRDPLLALVLLICRPIGEEPAAVHSVPIRASF
jgi:hypothetical protein